MELSIIIVNYNVKFFLEQCLHSVLRAVNTIDAEILVVDNHSTDGSIEYLQPLFPTITFISSNENLGFAKANNLALSKATGNVVLFLNPDTLVPEDCFIKCLHFLNQNAKAGALGLKMLDGSGCFLPESKRSFPSAATAIYKATGLSTLFPTSPIFNKYALGHLDEKENNKVDVLAGAFMMVCKNVLDEVGGFDEQFFMYGEDIDLSYRIIKAGYENWYFAETAIIHFKGESLKKWSANHVKVFYEAMIVFVKKHYKGNGVSVLKLLLISGIRVKSLLSLITGVVMQKHQSKSHATGNILIIGNEKEYNECAAAYVKTSGNKLIHLNTSGNVELFTGVAALCKNETISEIVFCFGTWPLSKAMLLMQQLGSYYNYRFHAEASKSIVGSNSKSSLGQVLTLN